MRWVSSCTPDKESRGYRIVTLHENFRAQLCIFRTLTPAWNNALRLRGFSAPPAPTAMLVLNNGGLKGLHRTKSGKCPFVPEFPDRPLRMHRSDDEAHLHRVRCQPPPSYITPGCPEGVPSEHCLFLPLRQVPEVHFPLANSRSHFLLASSSSSIYSLTLSLPCCVHSA